MQITNIHNTAIAPFENANFSDFTLSSAKGRERRAQKKIDKARTQGAMERAKLGLEDGPPLPSAASGNEGGSKTLIYAGIGAAILVTVIVIFLLKR